MQGIRQALNYAAGRLLQGISPGELSWLLTPHRHMPLFSNRRAEMMLSRVQFISVLFSLLTIGWIVVDVWLLPWPLWGWFMLARLVAGAGFAALAVYAPRFSGARAAQWCLGAMFAIPTLFYVFSHILLGPSELYASAVSLRTMYAFLPFVVIVGLAIFPLTLLEAAAFSVSLLVITALMQYSGFEVLGADSDLGLLWVLLLISMVVAIAGMSQLAFFIVLMRQTVLDPLTGVFSRQSGEELLKLQLSLASRNKTPVVLAFVDLDNFKSVNDDYGHETGDRVLKSAAAQLRALLRASDAVIRWGGEEFVLILFSTELASATRFLDDRMHTPGLGSRPDGRLVTASIGLAEMNANTPPDWRGLVDIADRRMYLAKKAGKNRIVSSDG